MQVVTKRDDLARSCHSFGSRCEQRKLYRPAQRESERAAGHLDELPFLVPARYNTKRFWLAFAFQTHVKGMRGAPANSPSHAAADEGIVCSSPCNCQLQRLMP